jgi:hypothetical protein
MNLQRQDFRAAFSAAPALYLLRWPFTIFFTLRFCDPRATSAGRFAFGAAFFRAVRFAFFRSARSLMFFVFIFRYLFPRT